MKSLYGIYPGKLKYDTKYIESCSEMELFIQVNDFMIKTQNLKFLNYCDENIKLYQQSNDEERVEHFKSIKQNCIKKELSKNSLFLDNLEEYVYSLDYCILQTARFGTNVEYNPTGRVIKTKEFNEWYNNWRLFISSMDDASFSIYRKYRYEGKSLECFKLNKKLTQEEINNLEDNDEKIYVYTKKENIKHSYA